MEQQTWIRAAQWLEAQALPVLPLLALSGAPDAALQAALLQEGYLEDTITMIKHGQVLLTRITLQGLTSI